MSKQVLRLEKKKIFPNSHKDILLQKVISPEWILGDTLALPPTISNENKTKNNFPYLLQLASAWQSAYTPGEQGKLNIIAAKDTVLKYVILYSADMSKAAKIFDGMQRVFRNTDTGMYTLLLVDKNYNTLQKNNLCIKQGTTLCIDLQNGRYTPNNPLFIRVYNEITSPRLKHPDKQSPEQATDFNQWQNTAEYAKGKGVITGTVVDNKGGLPVAFASVTIKGSRTATATDANGHFIFKNIKNGRCVLVATSVGYRDKEITVDVNDETSTDVKISVQIMKSNLDEIIVTGYSSVKRKDITGFISIVQGRDLSGTFNSLTGKVMGLQVSGAPGSNVNIILRGLGTTDNANPLFVIDGIAYDVMPANITPDMIGDITVLKGAEATGMYGMKAANGVMLITTKTKTLRQQFRDYAFWQPQLFTDQNGQAKFEVTYPDNTTGWQTYVLGMDKHRRMGKAVSFVQSYKPVMAQLSMPQFLIEGDSAQPVGKALNYTGDVYNATMTFSLNGLQTGRDAITLQPKASVVKQYSVIAPQSDTLKAAFSLQTSTGFKDGEERKIPVFKQGTEEATGSFWVLKNDTSISFESKINGSPVELYAQNNTLDILLDEIEHLKTYPYYCMEQTSSKLRGLLMEKKIYEALHKPFADGKTINWLVQKLQKGQLYSGCWGWWENSDADINITNYVIKALLPLRDNPLVETNIRNGLLYLQNELAKLDRDQLLSTISTLCQAHHLLDYTPWLQKIYFDSLTIHQQWQYVNIKQLLNQEHSAELKSLLSKSIPGMLGALHWGDDNYRWYSDANATTSLAFEVLRQEKGYDNQLDGMIQYFLEQRKQGYWVNTVTSASVVSATLPYLLAQNNNFQKPASIKISGDTGIAITQFPYKTTIGNAAARQFTISKTGGGLVYLTAYQRFFNRQPQPVTNNFNIHTSFEKNGRPVAYLTAGERVTMVIQVDALKEAEYVMMEIPIPAGCLYASKKTIWMGYAQRIFKK